MQSGDPRLAESGLLVFTELARYLVDLMRPYIDPLQPVFGSCLAGGNPAVCVATLRAIAAFLSVGACAGVVVAFAHPHTHTHVHQMHSDATHWYGKGFMSGAALDSPGVLVQGFI